MFGRVTHTLDAAAKRVRPFVPRHSHSVTSPSVVIDTEREYTLFHCLCFTDRVLATINLYLSTNSKTLCATI